MGSYGIEIEFPSPYRSGRWTWVMTCRGCTRYMDEVHVPKSDHNNPAKNWLRKKQLKLKNLVLRIGDRLALRKLMPQAIKSPETVCYTQSARPIWERKWKIIPDLKDIIHFFKKLSRKSWRNSYDIAIRKKEILTGLCTGIQFIQDYWINLAAKRNIIIHSEIGFEQSMKEATRKGSSTVWIPKIKWLMSVHTGGHIISSELMGHVEITIGRSTYSTWFSYDLNSIMDKKTHCWRKRKERRKVDSFLHTSQFIWWNFWWGNTSGGNPSQYPEKYIIEIPGETIRTLYLG